MWSPTKTKKYGVVLYNYKPDTRYGLSLEIGETVQILEECQGWFRGFSSKNRSVKGIFPANYIFLKPSKVDNEGLFESVIPLEDPVVREVTLVLREWGDIWKKLYVERETYKYQTLRKVMRELLDWRRQLLTGTLTQDQTRELKLKITSKIDWGNRKLGLDLVPRVGAQMVDPDTMSVVELYQVHLQSAENSQGASKCWLPNDVVFLGLRVLSVPLDAWQARGTMKRRESRKLHTHHLYVCLRDLGHRTGEDTELYFSLYDAAKQRYISERFLVKISKEGFSNYVEKLNSNCTIFTDLGNADIHRDVFLVCHVTRVGRMVYTEGTKKSSSSLTGGSGQIAAFRRAHACSILNLAELLQPPPSSDKDPPTSNISDEKELTMKLYQADEKDFHQLHEMLIKKQSNKYSPLPGQPNYGIVISARVLHGELNKVREENPLLLKSINITKKLGFPDVIMPGDYRNDLYLTLVRGEFERGGKSSPKNIQATVCVLDRNGQLIQKCLYGASGMEGSSEYHSLIVYHHNAPWWQETIRVTVPIDQFYDAHLRIEYRHCSTRDKSDNKKLFGFSFARLMAPGGATVADGCHELFVYKCEDASRLEGCSYLELPCSARDSTATGASAANLAFTRSAKECVQVTTLLCSTKLTQNVDLLSLLQWKEHPQKIQEALARVLRLDGEELVKFLQDVLDALFAMFSTEDGNSTTHSGPVFHALVSIFSLLEDSKFEHFKPVMDAYITGHFAAALVYKGLLSSVQHCTDWVAATDKQEPFQKCFRSLEYIFKLIIQSRLLFSRATGGQYEDTFRRDLSSVFTALNKMLATSYHVILPTQVSLLENISFVYEQLVQVLPVGEVARLATGMLESLPTRELPPQLTQAKLVAIRNMVQGQLFHEDESRNILLSTCCKHLRYHLAHRDELRLCTEILAEILSFLFKQRQSLEQGKVNNCLHHDVEVLCLATIDMLVSTVLIIIDRSSTVLGCLVACLIGLLQLMDECHYKRLWEELTERKFKKDFLLRVFLVLRDLVKQEVFPLDWLVIKMVCNHVMLNSLQELAQPLLFHFLEPRTQFDKQLWSNYFNLAVAFLTQPSLQLDKFSDVKREKMLDRYGDMRVLMGFQILSMWSNLGEHKINFIPEMVGPFLEVTLVPEPELRKATLHIFFDMMECEQKARGSFKQVESELIDKLDILISENKGDDGYRQLFNTMEHLSAVLLERVQSEEPAWKESGEAFISSVTRLLERLLDYRSVIQGDENRDKRMSCTVNLLNFYKNEINRQEMYIRYLHKLHDLHLPAENYTEAAFTMALYAEQLGWSDTLLPADPGHFPPQPEWQRKEQLYLTIINYFDRGKCWEKGIPLCKDLADLYEKRLFDYNKLSQILMTQAKFFDNILAQMRFEPEYFRVGFYGLCFPLFVRNKLFIYRGLEYERIGAFTQRLQTEFPAAQILMKNTAPEDSILNSDCQYIQICNVKPIPEDHPVFSGSDVPEKISAFYQVNDVRTFQLDRPTHRGNVDKDNEFKSMWLERQRLVISSPLPGILRWFEVVEKTVELVAPVQVACETMQSANRDLKRLVNQFSTDPSRNINPFTMRLQGTIDATVMGGISKYQTAFLISEFIEQHPEMAEDVSRLRALTLAQLDILDKALTLHGQLAPAGVQPLHRRLVERFSQLRLGLRSLYHQSISQPNIINTPLPPLPTEKRYSAQDAGIELGSLNRVNSDEDIYSKPMEILEHIGPGHGEMPTSPRDPFSLPPPPIPQRETRPRSTGYNLPPGDSATRIPNRTLHEYCSLPSMRAYSEDGGNGSASPALPRPPKATHHRSLSKPLTLAPIETSPSDKSRNSWPESTSVSGPDEAPPLPPRGHTPDKRNTGIFLDMGSATPPAPPKKLVKKWSTGTSTATGSQASLLDLGFSDQSISGQAHDLRDSGYSEFPTPTPTNNFNDMSYEDFQPRNIPAELNIPKPMSPALVFVSPSQAASSADSPSLETEQECKVANTDAPPPPIPPKTQPQPVDVPTSFQTENYSIPKLHTQNTNS